MSHSVKEMQDALMSVRFCSKPVVTRARPDVWWRPEMSMTGRDGSGEQRLTWGLVRYGVGCSRRRWL